MREIKMYKSNDGVIWDTVIKALERDHEMSVANQLLTMIDTVPTGFRGWYQHDVAKTRKFRQAVLDTAKKLIPNKYYGDLSPEQAVHCGSLVSRIMSEGDGPLRVVWNRACRIDLQGREWDQQWYVLNQDKAMVEHPKSVNHR